MACLERRSRSLPARHGGPTSVIASASAMRYSAASRRAARSDDPHGPEAWMSRAQRCVPAQASIATTHSGCDDRKARSSPLESFLRKCHSIHRRRRREPETHASPGLTPDSDSLLHRTPLVAGYDTSTLAHRCRWGRPPRRLLSIDNRPGSGHAHTL
jgi:hypothetical protein